MPWTAEEAERHTKKADSPKRQRMWAEIANSVLADIFAVLVPGARAVQSASDADQAN